MTLSLRMRGKRLATENTTGAKPSTKKKPIQNELLPSTKVISHSDSTPRTGKNPTLKNKLLEEKDSERLDPRAACTPGRADPDMATVGEIDQA